MLFRSELLEQFRDLSLVCERSPQSVKLGMLKVNSDFLNSIKEAQKIDVKFVGLMAASDQNADSDSCNTPFSQHKNFLNNYQSMQTQQRDIT